MFGGFSAPSVTCDSSPYNTSLQMTVRSSCTSCALERMEDKAEKEGEQTDGLHSDPDTCNCRACCA